MQKQTIAELTEKLKTLSGQIQVQREDPLGEMKSYAEIIRIIQRAMKGLAPDDDAFFNLINTDDIRQYTRLDETALLSHSAMRTAASYFPEFKMFEALAEMEDPYYISQDGEGRKEGILLLQAKSKYDANLILNMPNTSGGVAETEQPQANPPKKKGFLSRVLHR